MSNQIIAYQDTSRFLLISSIRKATEDDYVQYVFRPKASFEPVKCIGITNPVLVELMNRLPLPRYSPLILDGGNVVKAENKVTVTDRVIKDNLHHFTEAEIRAQLEKDLKCPVIIVPEYPGELSGHADGLIRFIDDSTVLINETDNEKERKWLRNFLKVLSENQLLHIKVPCKVPASQTTAIGLYINYLHVGNLIVVPQFKMKSDLVALQTLQKVFYNKTVIPCDARKIAEGGGVLNCASWTVKSEP